VRERIEIRMTNFQDLSNKNTFSEQFEKEKTILEIIRGTLLMDNPK
jgi:hypothetical protein